MKILCITHADFESPGVIKTWAKNRGDDFKILRPYKNGLKTIPSDFDFLIVMGGPQSYLEVEKSPYLEDEIRLITEAIHHKKIVLGFCLGAQLIGEALGAGTERSPEKEIGVYPINLTDAGIEDPLLQGLPHSFPVIHWHNDMPGVSKGASILAYSEGCPRQIIRYQPLVYGFQCHLEMTLEGIETMLKAVPHDLKPSKYTQNKETLLKQDYESINQLMLKLLDKLLILKSKMMDEKIV